MQVKVVDESGYTVAFFGIGLSFSITSGKTIRDLVYGSDLWNKLNGVAHKLAHKGSGENKFLRQIQVVLDVNAPFYFWKEADTYKIGTTTQSESTMHTIMKKEFTSEMFEIEHLSDKGMLAFSHIIDYLNRLRCDYFLEENEVKKKIIWKDIISILPSCWLQRRIVTCNYAVLQNIYAQRQNHKLSEWHVFCDSVLKQVRFPEFISMEKNNEG